MNVTTTPAPKSSVQLEVELPPERLSRAVDDAVRRLARRTRVAGFRPGKAPRFMLERILGPGTVLDEAVEQLVEDAYREAIEQSDIVPLTRPEVEIVQAEEGKPLVFKANVPVRPEVKLGDYRNFNFTPSIPGTDDEKVDRVVEELRDEHAMLAPVEGRVARKGDYAVIGFVGTRDGVPFEGGSSERMPLILGQERLIPGFEEHVVGLEKGGRIEFDITFPEDYSDESLRGQQAHFAVELKELREKVMPPADDDFARGLGNFNDMADMRTEIRKRLERNALDSARHEFADRIIEYATANADVELPDVLVDQEVEVMHDELRTTLARQGIEEAAYLKVVEKTEEQLHAEFRPQAEKRVKVLLVLGRIAEEEGLSVGDDEVEAEIARARAQYGDDAKVMRYFDSERGRNYVRSTMRRSKLVEKLIDEWLAAHPDHPRLPHIEESESIAAGEPGAVEGVPQNVGSGGAATPTEASPAADASAGASDELVAAVAPDAGGATAASTTDASADGARTTSDAAAPSA